MARGHERASGGQPQHHEETSGGLSGRVGALTPVDVLPPARRGEGKRERKDVEFGLGLLVAQVKRAARFEVRGVVWRGDLSATVLGQHAWDRAVLAELGRIELATQRAALDVQTLEREV